MKQQSFIAELKSRMEYHRRLATLYEEALKAETNHLAEAPEGGAPKVAPAAVPRVAAKGNPTREWLRNAMATKPGLTSSDIRSLARSEGYQPTQNFPYTTLWEWKKAGEIEQRGHKYYPIHRAAAAG